MTHEQTSATLSRLKTSALTAASHALLSDCDETGSVLIDVALSLDAVLKHFDGNGDPDLLVAEAFIDAARRTINVLGTGHRIVALGKAERS